MNNRIETLPKEVWEEAAGIIEEVAPLVGAWLKRQNDDGKGEEDSLEFMAHMHLAFIALSYVAKFAADKCRIIVMSDDRGLN